MNEQSPENKFEIQKEMYRRADDADAALKAALYDVNLMDVGYHIDPVEFRRDVRRAAVSHGAFLEYLQSGGWVAPPYQEEYSDQAFVSNRAGIEANLFLNDMKKDHVPDHLKFAELNTPDEHLFLDRYATWLRSSLRATTPQSFADSPESVQKGVLQIAICCADGIEPSLV